MPHKDRERRNAYMREYYARNPDTQRKRVRDRAQRLDAEVGHLIETAKSVPCLDCGIAYPHFVMDFDHVRGTKLAEISAARHMRWSIHKIKQEIAKCEVVCANCHRLRTYTRLMEAIREGRKPNPDDLTLW